jgi:adenylosuccinate synthase
LPNVTSVLTPGVYLDIPTVLAEIRQTDLSTKRVAIDPHAWVITEHDIESEMKSGLRNLIGSTGSGTGAAVARRVLRSDSGTFAKDIPELKPYIRETAELLARAMKSGQRVVVEGTQGFGLSILHSRTHPYCTSRDTTAASFISEAGLSPIDVDEIVLVIRSFPIRVAGTSGPLSDEIDWATITAESGYPNQVIEYTSVTQKVRRVARFNSEIVKRAIDHNRPTSIVLNHLDYIDARSTAANPTRRASNFVMALESAIGAPISFLGFSPSSLTRRESWNQRTA